ncbi:phosphodiester glycosidase family protein [Leptothoe spongobia]|uniref:Phosphodiester glycosidase family protein n=1 Tax=Leptothoe spongobia TAU-MAC 1115 TaxID=1967444 RepID=A0A947D966_9CYAN|nr:phosphodiester glycosidase family protein [Leptothoe spongobia]MBT9313808.1 phosphodiester glycosidase family protein [Leptothoe spongobia TAU-MAC 1115]
MQRDKKHRKLSLFLGFALGLTQCSTPPVIELEPIDVSQAPVSRPQLTVENWPDDAAAVANVHIVTIPPNYPMDVAVDEGLKTVEEFAVETKALGVLNGGFFDPNNAQTTSFITVDGSLVADPRDNSRLLDNSDLAVYMEQILNRSEFRRYDCGEAIRYDITFHQGPVPDNCVLHSALGAGPQLLPDDSSQAEGFTDYADGTLIRDAIGSQQRNARSTIGIKQDGTLVWVMVAQITPSGGMTLPELSAFMASLGIQKALNLDGGSSSSLYASWPDIGASDIEDGVQPRSYYGRLDQMGQTIQRPVKSVLLFSRETGAPLSTD